MHEKSHYPANYTTKIYLKKGLTDKQISFCEAYIAEGLPGVAAKIAGYKSPNRAGGYLLNTKRIRDYIAKRQTNYVNCPITFESKLQWLNDIVDTSLNEFKESKKTPLANVAMQAIEIANTMQGHNAPTQTQAVTVNVKATQDKLLESRKAYDEY
jgi:phage terminase small subunit